MKKKLLMAGAASLCMTVVGPTPSQAGYEIWDTSVSSCATLNCSSIVMGGTVMSFPPTAAKWEAAVFAAPGECLRIDEIAMFGVGSDDKMVVVGPNGTIWRNDDFGGTLRPRVAFVAPQNGWYYVVISRWDGSATPPNPAHNIMIAYGRYAPSSNPNCAGPTPPASPLGTTAKPAAPAAGVPDLPGSPGGH